MLLTACKTETFRTAKPDLAHYSKGVQLKAKEELTPLKPCARDFVYPDCSAMARMVMDYKDMREKIRSAD